MNYAFCGIDHIQLAAPPDCEVEARHFFGEVLLMQEIEKPEKLKINGGVWFQCGEQQLHIGVDTHFVPAKKAHPAIFVTNLDALRQKLLALDYSLKNDALPGIDRFHVDDPFGNRLEFMEQI
ncbi:glyoxalase [Sulfoacidibacillus ferrooxidans]|uniref:VOC domain-containing protein n=1 Tax=Sulfoacidibacillus ferrooxidans TaxID=2005001 RepID=A0A9X1V9B3_9BACL|nr:glyoxalase [Sulfoacidibacillus ferrooxidans]MCI0183981.1 hypothetical protein [Sulfoacidibacillus ferrooxidans]